MIKETMTVHEALSELKVIGKRIEKEISGTTFIDVNKHSNLMINGKSISDYSANIESSYQKIIDLIKRREAIKRAITLSNATQVVDIDGHKMTVAEAIEYRNTGIMFKESLLNTMSYQYNNACRKVSIENGDVLEEGANRHVIGLFGGTEKTEGLNVESVMKAKEEYKQANMLDLINPLKIEDKIVALKDEIDRFRVKVDSALSVSNAVTNINIEY